MKIVAGGTGLIGSKIVEMLTTSSHHAVPASPESGVNHPHGKGLAGQSTEPPRLST
jgi:uncharacterized protein YbjT (DUF2867 family)